MLALKTPPLRVPATAAQLREAVALLDDWLQSFPPQFLHGKGPATGSGKGHYQRRIICRKFVCSLVRRMSPEALRDVTLADLAPANADMQGHVATAFPDSATWAEIRRAVGVSPVLLGCWCCLMSNVPEARLQHFQSGGGARVHRVVARLASEIGHAPSLLDIAKGLDE